MTRLQPELVTVIISLLVAGCVPLPQRVQDEFSPPDGQRPNNFEIVGAGDRSSTGVEQADAGVEIAVARPAHRASGD